tara:strand:- start:103 stop:360 length:258 start_codon:yes stop_codon:yes gene_type:complete
VDTADERSWSLLTNGRLLAAVENEGYEIFVTTDKNLTNQQNLRTIPFAIIVLSTTSWPRIQTASDKVKLAIDTAISGSITEIAIP